MINLEVIDREIERLKSRRDQEHNVLFLRGIKRRYEELNRKQSPERTQALEDIHCAILDTLDHMRLVSKQWRALDTATEELKTLVDRFREKFE